MADERPVIIKRIKKISGGHHGGAWKVAYADFVTAMMAFFLLLWLLNAVTEEQKQGIAQYFRPTIAFQNTSATFAVLSGQAQPMETMDGGTASQSDIEDPELTDATQPEPATGEGAKPVDLQEAEATVAQAEEKQLQEIKDEVKKVIDETPDLQGMERNLKIDKTEEGIRIQLLDQEKVSMFPSGSAAMNPRSAELLQKVAQIVKDLPNKIEISGHTDATPYAGNANYTNWELSTDRANASRRVLVESGIDAGRLKTVEGRADTDPFVKDNPLDPQNRRISIVLLREPKPASATPAPRSEPPAELVPNEPAQPAPAEAAPAQPETGTE
ncbi:MAG: flagellar motor protein MotB [Rhodospirillaceae bacterium]|nr:flagellar motor protein MotB [Rhodospirillaceae bacterium]